MIHLSATTLLMLQFVQLVPSILSSNPTVTQPHPVDNFEGLSTLSKHFDSPIPSPPSIADYSPSSDNDSASNNATRILRRGKRYLQFSKGSRMSVRMAPSFNWPPITGTSIPSTCSGEPMARTTSGPSTRCGPTAMASEPTIPSRPSRSRRRTMPSSFACLKGTSSLNWKPLWMGKFAFLPLRRDNILKGSVK